MKINSDFKDLLRSLNVAGVRYLVVGGYAVMVHTEPRYTKDIDIWIEPTENNAGALRSLAFGFQTPLNAGSWLTSVANRLRYSARQTCSMQKYPPGEVETSEMPEACLRLRSGPAGRSAE